MLAHHRDFSTPLRRMLRPPELAAACSHFPEAGSRHSGEFRPQIQEAHRQCAFACLASKQAHTFQWSPAHLLRHIWLTWRSRGNGLKFHALRFHSHWNAGRRAKENISVALLPRVHSHCKDKTTWMVTPGNAYMSKLHSKRAFHLRIIKNFTERRGNFHNHRGVQHKGDVQQSFCARMHTAGQMEVEGFIKPIKSDQ